MQNYNMAALMGADVTDADYAAEFNLPIEAVGTPLINQAMLDKVMADNVMTHMDNGDSESEAKSKAQTTRNSTQKWIDEALARKGML